MEFFNGSRIIAGYFLKEVINMASLLNLIPKRENLLTTDGFDRFFIFSCLYSNFYFRCPKGFWTL